MERADWLLPALRLTERAVAAVRREVDGALREVQLKLLRCQTARDPAVAEWVLSTRQGIAAGTVAHTASNREEILRALEAFGDPSYRAGPTT